MLSPYPQRNRIIICSFKNTRNYSQLNRNCNPELKVQSLSTKKNLCKLQRKLPRYTIISNTINNEITSKMEKFSIKRNDNIFNIDSKLTIKMRKVQNEQYYKNINYSSLNLKKRKDISSFLPELNMKKCIFSLSNKNSQGKSMPNLSRLKERMEVLTTHKSTHKVIKNDVHDNDKLNQCMIMKQKAFALKLIGSKIETFKIRNRALSSKINKMNL